MPARLSIVTPTLNCAGFIRATLESVRPLVGQGAEHVVVDSGSTDGTVELCHLAGALVIEHPRGNMYAAINAGVRHSRGDWVTYINGDDLLYADAIEAMLKGDVAGADVLYGNIDHVDAAGRFLHHWKSPRASQISRAFPAGLNPVFQQGTLFTRHLFKRLNGFSADYYISADFDFFLRAFVLKARFQKFEGAPVAAFRLHRNQLSQVSGSQAQHEQVLESCRRNGIKTSGFARFTGFLLNRGRNVPSFVVRVLRHRHMGGGLIVPRTMDVPAERNERRRAGG